MPLNEDDRDSVRFHLGYPNTSPNTTMAMGLPINLDGLFILEGNMNNLRESGVARVRSIVQIMDDILFGAKVDAIERMAVKRIGSIETQPDEVKMISRQLYEWACVLADQLRAPLYYGCERYKSFIDGGPNAVGNVRVR